MDKEKNSLVAINEDSIFYKIKNFFKKIFFKNRNEEVVEDYLTIFLKEVHF